MAADWFMRLPCPTRQGQLQPHLLGNSTSFQHDLPLSGEALSRAGLPSKHLAMDGVPASSRWVCGGPAMGSALQVKLFRKPFHSCQFLANAKLTKAIHSTHKAHWIYKWLWQWAYLFELSTSCEACRNCSGLLQLTVLWVRFLSFIFLIFFPVDLKSKAKIKGWGCCSVGKMRPCHASVPSIA